MASFYGYRLNKRRLYRRQEFLNLLESRSACSYDQCRAWQREAVRDLLAYAVEKVPYYRDWWKDRDHSRVTDIQQWPVLEKEIVRNHPRLFVSDDFRLQDLSVMHTSGTSGKPMTIYLSPESIGLWYTMYDERIKRANGVDPEKDAYGNLCRAAYL